MKMWVLKLIGQIQNSGLENEDFEPNPFVVLSFFFKQALVNSSKKCKFPGSTADPEKKFLHTIFAFFNLFEERLMVCLQIIQLICKSNHYFQPKIKSIFRISQINSIIN